MFVVLIYSDVIISNSKQFVNGKKVYCYYYHYYYYHIIIIIIIIIIIFIIIIIIIIIIMNFYFLILNPTIDENELNQLWAQMPCCKHCPNVGLDIE